jgi:isopenicillin N synthase-like dioxygenase
VAMKGESLDPSRPGDLKEAFNIGLELEAKDPRVLRGEPFRGINLWPEIPLWRQTMLAYFDAVASVGRRLHRAIATDLGVHSEFFEDKLDQPMATLRLLHYPPQPPDGPGEIHGTRNHTDTDTFTILAQDMNGGLEVLNKDREWVAVPPIADSLVVNVGEILKVWTDGIFSSTVHRVINRSGRERYSIPFFLYPTYEEVISPILRNPDPSNIAPEDLPSSMPRDKPFVWGEFKARNSARIHPKRPHA